MSHRTGSPGPATLALSAPGARLRCALSLGCRWRTPGGHQVDEAIEVASSRELVLLIVPVDKVHRLRQNAPLWLLRLQRQTRSQSMISYDVTAEPRGT